MIFWGENFWELNRDLYFIPVSAVSHFMLDLWLSFPLHSSALSHLMASSYHVTSVLEPFLLNASHACLRPCALLSVAEPIHWSNIGNLYHISKGVFRSKNFWVLGTVALSFLFGN